MNEEQKFATFTKVLLNNEQKYLYIGFFLKDQNKGLGFIFQHFYGFIFSHYNFSNFFLIHLLQFKILFCSFCFFYFMIFFFLSMWKILIFSFIADLTTFKQEFFFFHCRFVSNCRFPEIVLVVIFMISFQISVTFFSVCMSFNKLFSCLSLQEVGHKKILAPYFVGLLLLVPVFFKHFLLNLISN